MTSCGDSSPKSNPVVVAPVGERCNSRKVAYQAWLQNKAESSLHSLYAELMCKSPQYSRWKSPKFNIGTIADINWILVTGKWTKYIVKTIRCKRGKKSHHGKSIEDQNGALLCNEEDILGRWRTISSIFWTLSLYTIRHTGGTLGGGK